jgi:DNA repair exonuclease SbcCD ATPase subunit
VSTELSEVSKAVAEFDRVGAGLAALREQYGNVVYDVTTTAGMADAKAARVAIREPRYEIERIRKAAKAPILALGKKLDTEAARITSELEKLERPIDSAIKAEEDRKEAEKQAKIEAEQKRVANLQERVAYLRGNQTLSASSGSDLIAGHIEDLEGESVEGLEEFEQQGIDAKTAGLARLRALHAAALAHEAEQARIKAERAELERLRAAEAERQAAERARIAEEERQARAAREAEAARQTAELRKQREALEAENARVRAEQEAAARAERERIAEERAALAREQEALRKAQEPPPAPPPLPPAPVSRRGVAVPVPKAAEMIDVLAKHYRARPDTIIEWLRAIDWKQAEAA